MTNTTIFIVFFIIITVLLFLLIQRIQQSERKAQVNDRKKAEDRLEICNQYYHSLFEHNLDAVFVTDVEGQFLNVNPATESLCGYAKKELLHRTLYGCVDPNYLEGFSSHVEKAVNGQAQSLDSVVVHKDGHHVDLNISLVPIIVKDEVIGLIGIAKDVTIKKREEREWQQTQRQLDHVFKETDIAIWSVEMPSYKLLQMSPACEKIFGYSQQHFIEDGFLWDKIIHPEDLPINKKLRQKVFSGITIQHEYRIIHSSGEIKWVHDRVIPARDHLNNITRFYGVVIDVTERKQTEEKINHMAFHDTLTGLPNSKKFHDYLSDALLESNHSEDRLAIMYVDVDRFKNINESFGHSFGDIALKGIADRITECMTKRNIVSRVVGDEFLLLLPHITGESEAEVVANRIVEAFKHPLVVQSYEFHLTVSIGIAMYPSEGMDGESLTQCAHIAMSRTKELGKNNYQIYSPHMKAKVHNRIELENDLRKAIENNEMLLHYQPQIDIMTGSLIGVEALIRWNHPSRGLIPPADFIPLAEESGLIVPIGEWVLRTACKQNKAWHNAGFQTLSISVNLSIRQFLQSNLIHKIAQILKETELDPQYLDLEITESMTMDVEHAINMLHELKKLGVQISMDDFGTGYSSLNHLQRFPIDRLKIDKSFMDKITSNVNDANIVTTIIALAHNLGLKVTAEGVETNEQLQFLIDRNCDETQGYYFSKPVPAEQIELMISKAEPIM